MSSNENTRATASTALSQRLAAAAFGGLIGLFLIYGVGFAHPETIHNAAHDTRHAASFPCH
jgi:cobalt transporter subunit CbtB